MQSNAVELLAFAQTDSIFDPFVLFVIDYSLVCVLVVQLLVCDGGIERQGQVLIREEEYIRSQEEGD
jgi:hypothetical protein